MNKKPLLGLHLKLKTNLTDLINEAQSFNINIFQFFLTKEKTGKYLKLNNKDVKNFIKLKKKFNNLYIHSSYWINLSSGKRISYQTSQKILKKEIELSKKLQANALILHPGCATNFISNNQDPKGKLRGIENLSKALNKLLKKEHRIKILLENTAHANRTIGSNLNNFKLIRERLYYPDKVKFCLDSAHAFSYGYDITKTEKFVEYVDQTIGTQNIELIHLNDSMKEKSSKIDNHALPGEGKIGKKALKNLIIHKKLKKTPIILELPNTSTKNMIFALKMISKWLG